MFILWKPSGHTFLFDSTLNHGDFNIFPTLVVRLQVKRALSSNKMSSPQAMILTHQFIVGGGKKSRVWWECWRWFFFFAGPKPFWLKQEWISIAHQGLPSYSSPLLSALSDQIHRLAGMDPSSSQGRPQQHQLRESYVQKKQSLAGRGVKADNVRFADPQRAAEDFFANAFSLEGIYRRKTILVILVQPEVFSPGLFRDKAQDCENQSPVCTWQLSQVQHPGRHLFCMGPPPQRAVLPVAHRYKDIVNADWDPRSFGNITRWELPDDYLWGWTRRVRFRCPGLRSVCSVVDLGESMSTMRLMRHMTSCGSLPGVVISELGLVKRIEGKYQANITTEDIEFAQTASRPNYLRKKISRGTVLWNFWRLQILGCSDEQLLKTSLTPALWVNWLDRE